MSKISLLGYDEFGAHAGMNPLAGMALGGGLSVLTGALVRGVATSASWQANSDLAGFGAGAAVGAVLYGTGNEAAGISAVAAAFLASAVRYIESKWSTTPPVTPPATPPGATAGVGYPVINQLGLPVINQLGMATIDPVKHAYGTAPGAGVAGLSFGHGPPVSLLGPGSPQQMQAQLMAGPTLPRTHGLASHYGANLFGIGS